MSDARYEKGQGPKDDSDVDVDREALEALCQELAPMMTRYQEDVLSKVEPSTAYRASMHKMMLSLVREDVLEGHKKSSWTTRLAGRVEHGIASWRELVETSSLFRFGTQAACALGLGLLLSMAWISSIDTKPVAARTILEGQEDLAPQTKWKPRLPQDDSLRPSPLGDFPRIPAEGVKKKKNR